MLQMTTYCREKHHYLYYIIQGFIILGFHPIYKVIEYMKLKSNQEVQFLVRNDLLRSNMDY